MKEFNKLVRDKIPDMIRAQGEIPFTRVLETEEYKKCLDKKLDEEIKEFRADHNLEELADILEVIYALCKADGHTIEELHALRKKKHDARGGFDERIFLIGKE